MRELSIRVLGPLEVAAGNTIVDMGSPRQRAVFAVLASLANETVSADRIIDEVWGESPPAKASHSLQTYVSNLRRNLGRERIETRRPGYLLHVEDGELDAARFESLLAGGRRSAEDPRKAVELLDAAVALWRSDDPYAGLADEVPVLRQEAARLTELRLVAVEHLAEARLALGEHDTLVPELQDITERFPFREGLWSLLMRALYASGRQAEALRAYRRLSTALVEELGIDPSPELRELEQRLLTQTESTPTAPVTPAVSLPPTPSRFIGRAGEIEGVAAALDRGRLVTLTGAAGVGKTRLAIEVARRVADRFAGGTYFVDLAPVAAPGDVPGAVAAGLRLNDQSGRAPEEVVAEFLEARRALVVLDNCEHVSDEAARLVWSWLGRGTGVHVLASSQGRLELEGEQVVTVAPLGLPESDAAAAESDAVRLFTTRAAEQVPDFAVDRDNLQAIVEICRMLDGLPLAIELAAARTRTLAPAEIVARLDDRFALLGSGGRSRPDRHQTLRRAVEWSYSLLDDRGRAAFEHLAILAGNFTYEAAADVAGSAIAERDFLEVLDDLVTRSLVIRVPSGGDSRYRMLETLRLFGRERLADQGNLETLERRRASFFASLALRQADRVRSQSFEEAVAEIDADLDNIRASFRWSIENGAHDIAFDLTRPLWSLVFVGARRHLHEGEEWRTTLLSATRSDAMRARLLAEKGFARFLLGEQKEAIESAEESLAIVEGGPPERALALQVIALCAATNRETDRALELAGEVEATAADHPDARGLETAAMAYIFGGRGAEAVAVVEQIFEKAARTDDPLRRVRALALMGAALQSVDLDRSLSLLDEAVATTDELGMDWDLAGAVMARAGTRLMRGDVPGSLGDLERATRLTHRVRDLRRLAQTLEILGAVLGRVGRSAEGVRLLGAAEAMRNDLGVVGSEAEETRRREAREGLEADLSPAAFADALRWGREASVRDAARFAADAAAAASTAMVRDD